MKHESGKPFDSLESAHDFLRLLTEEIMQARRDVESDIEREADGPATRRRDALRVAAYNLKLAQQHLTKTTRIFNDLRSLRRLLFEERAAAASMPQKPAEKPAPKAPVVLPPPAPVLVGPPQVRPQPGAPLPISPASIPITAVKGRSARAGD